MAAAIDSGFIAASLSLPETTITSLQQQPTIDLVNILLQHIQQKAQDFETTEATKLQLEVELETLSRETESISQHAKETSEKHLRDLEEARQKLAREETARASLEAEIQSLKTESANHKAEVETARARITDLETSKREALNLTDSRNTNHTKLAEELASQQQKVNSLRRELAETEEKRQTAENVSSSAKFREQNLEQELEATKKHNAWLDEELSRRGTDHTKFRKEKNAKIAELQRLYEESTQEVDGLRRTESNLRSRLDELTRKVEDSVTKIQNLQEEAIKGEETSRTELNNTKLLGDLHQQSAEAARAHAQELQQQLTQLKDDAADEIGRLQAEIDSERQEREVTENRIADLETQLDKLRSEGASRRQPQSAAPATPRRGANGISAHGSPSRAGSPGMFSSPGMRLTNADQQQFRAMLEYEQRRSQRLSATIDEMVREMEARKPEMDELRTQYDHAIAEVTRLTDDLEVAQSESEKAKKDARKWHGEIAGVTREAELLRQQVRDLSLQLKVLLVEQQAEQQGLRELSISQRNQYEQVIRGELDESVLQGMSESGRFISQRLTIFRNVSELQEQNAQLLSATRQLTEDMEGEEAMAKRSQHEADKQELVALREQIAGQQHEIKTLETRAESYIRERDMFRQMISRRGNGESVLGNSTGGFSNGMSPARSRAQSIEQDAADQTKFIRELQASFDAYRQETTTDRTALKQQADRLSKEKNELQSSIAQIRSQLTLAQERHDLLQSNYNMLKSEHSELQKRTQNLSEAAIKQDARTQQTAEELVEARGFVDGLRIEIASLKAEREIWKKIESRMEEDNRALVDERSRLNKSMSDLQKLQNERELRDAEDRRQLQDRANVLDNDLQSFKRQLETEQEAARQASQRREYEQEQSRTRIDDLLKGIGNVKEDLVKAQTERDSLTTRVEELKLELRNAESRPSILQPRPSTRPTPITDENAPIRNAEQDTDRDDANDVDTEGLRADLQHAERLLDLARESEERYKALAAAAEDEVSRLNELYEQYRQDTEALVSERDSRIVNIEKRAEEATTELSKVNADYAQLRNSQDEVRRSLETQQQQLESEITRLRDDNERLTETARLHREDLKAQAEIAQQAQQSYEDELIKHSEAAKALQKVRQEYNELRSEVAGSKTEAQSAKDALEKSLESWNEQKKLLERDINELRIRRAESQEQNQVLLKQLDEFSKQLEEVKKSRERQATNGTAAPTTSANDHYQEIVRHLQREKQIVDMQYDMSSRDVKRLQHQLEATTQQLDETKERLAKELRTQIESERIQMDRDKLMQSINELNVFKESNALLRIESQQAREKIASLEKQVEELRAQLEPLRERNSALDNELEMKKGEYNLLQENRDFWEKRTQDIMSKHNRADPAEVESLKSQLADAQAERDRLQAEIQPLQDQISSFDTRLTDRIKEVKEEEQKQFEERRARLVDSAKQKAREQTQVIREKQTQIDAVSAETARMTAEIASLQTQIESLRGERDTAIAKAAATTTQQANANDEEEGQVDETSAAPTDRTVLTELQSKLTTAEDNLAKEAARAGLAENEVRTLQARVESLETQVTDLQRQLGEAQAAISLASETAAAATHGTTSEPIQPVTTDTSNAPESAELAHLRSELAATRQEIEVLRANANSSATAASGTAQVVANDAQTEPAASRSQGSDEPTEEQILARVNAVRTEIETELQVKHQEEVKKVQEQADAMVKERLEKMKGQLNEKLRQYKVKYKEETDAAQREEMDRLKAQLLETKAAQPSEPKSTIDDQPSVPIVKTEPTAPAIDLANLTGEQLKAIVQTPAVKGIISRNIKAGLAEKDAQLAERETQHAEEQKKAVEQAKAMEEKRGTLKLNIANNKANNAQAKIEVVERAAADTPQKPVAEVWEIAKAAKPTPVVKPAAPSVAATPAKPANAPQAQNTPAQASIQANAASASSTMPATAKPVPQNPVVQAQPASQPQVAPPTTTQNGIPNAQAGQPQQASGLPPRPNAAAGTGPAALRGLANQAQPQQPAQSGIPVPGSGIPVPGGGRGRGQQQPASAGVARGGSQLPRGGRGRGGSAPRGRGGGQGSPGLNGGARNFTPGGPGGPAKRPADGSPGGETDNKKPRGGGHAGS